MKYWKLYLCVLLTLITAITCKENVTENGSDTGALVLEAVKSMSAKKTSAKNIIHRKTNSKAENIIVMHTIDLKLTLTEIWVSKEEVKAGNKDDLTWHKIGENTQSKFFNEYKFTAENLPAGEYKSLKINFKNIFYRVAAFQSNHNNIVNMKERMGLENENDKWIGSCDDETSLAPTNYFSAGGNHNLKNGEFFVVNQNEKINGFEIKPGKVTKLYWKMGDERELDPYACTFEWIDENNNEIWDCGVDRMDNFNCNVNPPLETMWCFIVKYD